MVPCFILGLSFSNSDRHFGAYDGLCSNEMIAATSCIGRLSTSLYDFLGGEAEVRANFGWWGLLYLVADKLKVFPQSVVNSYSRKG